MPYSPIRVFCKCPELRNKINDIGFTTRWLWGTNPPCKKNAAEIAITWKSANFSLIQLQPRRISNYKGLEMKQRPNFKELPIEPSGLFWEDDFVDAEHEKRLISIFTNELKWPDRPGRISLHYGYTFDYKTFGIDPDIPYKEFPDWLQPLIPTTEDRLPDQVCLQFYPPGAGIPPHVDAHAPYDQLYALSLGAPAIMQFRQGERRVEVDLNPRSMMQMAGDSRLHWTHGIKKRKNDTLPDGTIRPRENRWSITYRWLRGGDCECGNLDLCDTAQSRNGTEKEKRSVKALAEKRNAQDQNT